MRSDVIASVLAWPLIRNFSFRKNAVSNGASILLSTACPWPSVTRWLALGIAQVRTSAVTHIKGRDPELSPPSITGVGAVMADTREVGIVRSRPNVAASEMRVGAILAIACHIGACRISSSISSGTPTYFMNRAIASARQSASTSPDNVFRYALHSWIPDSLE